MGTFFQISWQKKKNPNLIKKKLENSSISSTSEFKVIWGEWVLLMVAVFVITQ